MVNPSYLEIVQIIKKSEQGLSGVFYCKGEDDNFYWVKGHNVGRADQVKEWLCGHLAVQLELPIAPFCFVTIDEYLVKGSPNELQAIGHGPAFASKHAGAGATWQGKNVENIPEHMRQRILLFDYWIHNTDRTSQNPNLLWDTGTQSPVVIDHNWAFDPDTREDALVDDHLFCKVDRTYFRDLNNRCMLMEKMDSAIQHLEKQIDLIPAEWFWADLEQTRRADLKLPSILATLKRYQTNNEAFWSVL